MLPTSPVPGQSEGKFLEVKLDKIDKAERSSRPEGLSLTHRYPDNVLFEVIASGGPLFESNFGS